MRDWWRHGGFVGGALLVALFLLVALAVPLFVRADPLATATSDLLLPPQKGHLFGTDAVGRDLLARVVAGGRLSLLVGLLSRLVALSLGTTAGLAAGYFGGRVDGVIMRLADMALAFPALLLLIAVVAAFGPSLVTLFLALGLLGWRRWPVCCAARSSPCAAANTSRRPGPSAAAKSGSCSGTSSRAAARPCWYSSAWAWRRPSSPRGA